MLKNQIDRALVGWRAEYAFAPNLNVTPVRLRKPGYHPQQGSFSTPGWPQNRKKIPLQNLEGDIVDRFKILKRLYNIFDGQIGLHHFQYESPHLKGTRF